MKKLALFCVLFLTVGVAHADPVTSFLATKIIAGITIGQVLFTVGSMIYGASQQRRAEKKAKEEEQRRKDAYNAGLRDRLTQIASEVPHTYIYGRARVGSAVVAIFSSGSRDEYKHLVCVHAAHECDAFEEWYIGGKKLAALDGSGWVTAAPFFTTSTHDVWESHAVPEFTLAHDPVPGSVYVYTQVRDEGTVQCQFTIDGRNVVVTPPPFATFPLDVSYQYTQGNPFVNVRTHLGTGDDPADAYLMSVTGGQWPATAVLRGYCYSVITLNLNEPEFQGGLPTIETVIRGRKLYDPRTETTAWSQNPPLVIRDYLTSEICKVDADDIPDDAVIAAANVCDEEHAFGKRYTFNGSITSDQSKNDVLEGMAQSMAGGICSTTWDMWAGKYVAPIMALSQDDIVGELAITPGLSHADIYNGVKGQFCSPENNYVINDFKPYQNAAYVAADGGDELWSNIDFPYTNSLQRVHNLCRIFVEDQRNGYTVKGLFKVKTWRLRPGSRVTLTSALFGWSSKVFRITDKKDNPSGMVELTMKEDGESIWDFADAVVPDETPNTNLPDPFYVPKIASVTCQSGTNLLIAKDGTVISRVQVSWPAVQSQSVQSNGLIEVEWRKVDTDVYNKASVSGNETSTFISPAEDGAWYVVRVRSVNAYLNIKADWTYAQPHQVVGKTAPPGNMQQLSISGTKLSWAINSELDIAGSRFRFHYGNNRDWGTAAPLHEGLIVASPFDLVTRPAGMVTIMGKWVDTSGNESVTAAYIVTDLGDIPVANVVEEFDFKADGFPGEITGGEVDEDGNLVADEVDSFYGDDNQSFYEADNAPFYLESSYGKLVYVTPEISVPQPLTGSLMSLIIDTQGIDLTVEYRLTGPGPLFGDDDDSFFGPDDEPFYGPPGIWNPWPGQIPASFDVFQWRVTIGSGAVRGKISELKVVIDAPDMVEYIEDLVIEAGGTIIPYTLNFTAIKTVTPALQANESGAITVEVDKTTPIQPKLIAYNDAHVSVGGATSDVIIKGY